MSVECLFPINPLPWTWRRRRPQPARSLRRPGPSRRPCQIWRREEAARAPPAPMPGSCCATRGGRPAPAARNRSTISSKHQAGALELCLSN
jgi:hypothetical protein